MLTAAIATGAAVAISSSVYACGVCIEDKVAATYDHAIVHQAIASHRQVIFVALEGRDARWTPDATVESMHRNPLLLGASVAP